MSFGFRREDCTPPLPRSVRTRPSADWPFRSVRAEDLEGLPAEDMLSLHSGDGRDIFPTRLNNYQLGYLQEVQQDQ